MGNPVKPKRSGSGIVRPTHIYFLFTLFLTVASGAGLWWVRSTAAGEGIPALALASMTKDMRTFYGANGRFPKDLAELQEKVWQPRGYGPLSSYVPLQLTEANKSLSIGNYYYLYGPAIDPDHAQVANFFAAPLGPHRKKFPAMYVTIPVTGEPVIWQCPAPELADFKKIRGVMRDVD
jgi:hypothetical protein